MKKILYILFSLLFIITIAEFAYYIYTVNYKIKEEPRDVLKNNKLSLSSNSTIDPTVIQERLANPVQMEATESTGTAAIDPKMLDGLLNSSKYIQKDILKSYIVNIVVEGTISQLELYNQDQQKQDPNIPKFIMVIKGVQGGAHQLVYPQDSRRQVSYLKIYNKDNQIINITDLKIGDPVKIKIEIDITESNTSRSVNNWTINKL